MAGFDAAAAQQLLADVFAPWVQDLDLGIERIEAEGAVLRLRFPRDCAGTMAWSAARR